MCFSGHVEFLNCAWKPEETTYMIGIRKADSSRMELHKQTVLFYSEGDTYKLIASFP